MMGSQTHIYFRVFLFPSAYPKTNFDASWWKGQELWNVKYQILEWSALSFTSNIPERPEFEKCFV